MKPLKRHLIFYTNDFKTGAGQVKKHHGARQAETKCLFRLAPRLDNGWSGETTWYEKYMLVSQMFM